MPPGSVLGIPTLPLPTAKREWPSSLPPNNLAATLQEAFPAHISDNISEGQGGSAMSHASDVTSPGE
jgi:hypothetical protein